MSTRTTTPTSNASAPKWLHDLTKMKTHYEEDWGLPVTVDVGHERLVIPVGSVMDAINMPAALGEKVLRKLLVMMLAGPVIASTSGSYWTFLTQPAPESRLDIPSPLRQLEVYATSRGATTVIPSQPDAGEVTDWRWVQLPRKNRKLPPWHTVIGATNRVRPRSPGTTSEGQRHPAS